MLAYFVNPYSYYCIHELSCYDHYKCYSWENTPVLVLRTAIYIIIVTDVQNSLRLATMATCESAWNLISDQ